MEAYVVLFAGLLTIVLALASSRAWFCAILAAYRIFDIISYRLYFLFVKSRFRPWNPSTLRRSVAIVFLNIYELVVAFATLYIFSGEVREGSTVLSDPMSATYFSAITFTTVGYGDFVPTSTFSRLIVCAQLTSALVMLTFILPALIGLFGSSRADNNQKSTDVESTS